MKIQLRRLLLTFMGVAFAVLAGCGGGPKLVSVKGKVQYEDGRPVTAASICFIPHASAEGKGLLATSLLAEDGSFTLRTHPHGEGAVVGPYKVTISLGRGTPRHLAKYTREKDTPFLIDVPAEGKNDFILTLR